MLVLDIQVHLFNSELYSIPWMSFVVHPSEIAKQCRRDCSLLECDAEQFKRFGNTCYLHLQGRTMKEEALSSQKTVRLITLVVRTSNRVLQKQSVRNI
jgi:hypothetical protein